MTVAGTTRRTGVTRSARRIALGLAILATASSLGCSGDTTAGPTPLPATRPAVCQHFHPGHYFREADSRARNLDGLANITVDFGPGGPDLTDFAGLLYQVDWAMLEPSRGVYDFTRLDAVFSKVKSAGKFLRVKIMDRSFWFACNPAVPFVPSYVTQVPAAPGSTGCFADVWNASTMDGLIALHVAVAKHYEGDTSFVGFNTEETAIDVTELRTNPSRVVSGVYAQRLRFAKAVLSAAPDLIFISEMNWPMNNDLSHFSGMVDQSLVTDARGTHNGMGVSWPDSWLNTAAYTATDLPLVLPQIQCTQSLATSGTTPCSWYDLARRYNTKVVIAPNIQGGALLGTLAEADAHYAMLDTDLGAQMITWETWTAPNANYLRAIAIPTIRKHGGRLRNTVCPFS